MAAFGILAALRERDRSGEGQLVDVSMADGALSWLAMVAARLLRRRRRAAARRRSSSPARCSATGPYACADGWVTLGALEPKFWQAWCRGVGREDLIARQFERAGLDAHGEVEAIFAERTRDEWEAFARRARLLPGAGARARRGARLRARARRARWSSSSTSPARRAGAPARRAGQALAHARATRARARPGARRAHRGGAAPRPATAPRRSPALQEAGAVAGPRPGRGAMGELPGHERRRADGC